MPVKIDTSFEAAQKTQSISRIIIVGVGTLLTMLPVTMIVTVLKELVSIRYGVDTFWAHAFMSTSLVGAIVFAPLSGRLIDRAQSRKMVILMALTGNAICFFVMASASTFGILMLARFIEGAMHITALSAWLASGADLSSRGRSGRVMGALGGTIMFGVTIGVPLGGIIAKNEASIVLWAAGGVSLFTAMFALLAIRHHSHKTAAEKHAFLRLMRENTWLSIPYAYTFIDRLCIGVIVSTFTLYMTDILVLNPAERGGQLSIFLLPLALLCYPVGRLSDRIGRMWLMVTGSVLFGFAFMTYGFLDNSSLWLAMLVSGILSAIMFAPTLAMCKDLAPQEHYGTVFAGFNVAGSLGFMIGPLLGGGLFFWFKQSLAVVEAYRWTFVIAGVFELLCAAISLPFLLKLYRN